MRHALHPRLFQAFILTIALALTGCTTPQRGVPTAVIYDQNQDTFTVEVQPFAKDATPIYRDTLDLFTIIDGQKHPGLIPSAIHRVPDDRGDTKLWRGPRRVWYKSSQWRVVRWKRMSVPRVLDPTPPLKVQITRHDEFIPPYPIYEFRIQGASYLRCGLTRK